MNYIIIWMYGLLEQVLGFTHCCVPVCGSQATIPSDPMTSDPARNYPHHGFGRTGDVTAPVIYANYGTDDDFEKALQTFM